MIRTSSTLALAALVGALAPGCFLEPFDVEGHACTTQADCITGYRCEMSVCVAGEPLDAGVDADLDASTPPDATSDAHITPDATFDAGADAPITIDAPMTIDVLMVTEVGAMDAPMGPDGETRDADIREAGPLDAYDATGDAVIGADADQDAFAVDDAAPPTGDVGTDARP